MQNHVPDTIDHTNIALQSTSKMFIGVDGVKYLQKDRAPPIVCLIIVDQKVFLLIVLKDVNYTNSSSQGIAQN
jgi:hypothetical protein